MPQDQMSIRASGDSRCVNKRLHDNGQSPRLQHHGNAAKPSQYSDNHGQARQIDTGDAGQRHQHRLRLAQDRYAEVLRDVQLVLSLSTMLHGIGVGNMLPSWVRMVAVDINPAVVTKLADRGSSQTVGIVTDVGLFLHQLAERLKH